jgi:hypothetical protein
MEKFKMFSSDPYTDEGLKALRKLFRHHKKLEHIKIRGGEHGGAYPDYAGGRAAVTSAPFLLYSNQGANLYYPNGNQRLCHGNWRHICQAVLHHLG